MKKAGKIIVKVYKDKNPSLIKENYWDCKIDGDWNKIGEILK